MRDLTDEEKQSIKDFGSVGFTYQEVSINLGIPCNELFDQWENQKGEVYELYMQGRLQSEFNIRKSILDSAINGSSPSMVKMMDFYKQADDFQND